MNARRLLSPWPKLASETSAFQSGGRGQGKEEDVPFPRNKMAWKFTVAFFRVSLAVRTHMAVCG